MIDRRAFLSSAALAIMVAPLATKAEQARKSYRIGYLASDSPSSSLHYLEAFRQGLRELGYEEGQNIALERPPDAASAEACSLVSWGRFPPIVSRSVAQHKSLTGRLSARYLGAERENQPLPWSDRAGGRAC